MTVAGEGAKLERVSGMGMGTGPRRRERYPAGDALFRSSERRVPKTFDPFHNR